MFAAIQNKDSLEKQPEKLMNRNQVSRSSCVQLAPNGCVSVFSKDYQADSGMVLPSEELKRFTWTGSKQKRTLFGSVFYVPFSSSMLKGKGGLGVLVLNRA